MAGRPNCILTAVCCLLLSSLVSSRSLTASYTFPDPTAEPYRQTDADRAPHITHSSRSLATTYTVPDPPAELYRQIDADLAPYKARGINKSMVEGVFCGIRDPGFRVQIKNQEVYIVGEVKGFQSRNRNLKLALIDMASHHKDLPDADFVMGTYDWTATEVQSVAGMEDGGPVFAQTKKKEHTNAILYPDHTFTDWQEADTASWQTEQYILHRSAMHHPWVARDDRLMFRGSNLTGNRHLAYNFSMPPEVDIKVWDWVQEPKHESFVGLPQHCRNKYLLNWPGNSYSARLKYLLLCASVVVHSDNDWYEFFYPMLKHGEHFMRVRALNSTEDLNSRLSEMVQHLNSHSKRSRQIAKAGQRFATETLSAVNVREYWFRLIKAYSELQQFEVTISPDAVPLGSSVSHPRYVTYGNRTGCPEMPDLVFDRSGRASPVGHFPIEEDIEPEPVVPNVNATDAVLSDRVMADPVIDMEPVVTDLEDQLDQPQVLDTVVPELLTERNDEVVQSESQELSEVVDSSNQSVLSTIAF